MKLTHKLLKTLGFTIIELSVTIVVIGILSTVVYVAYVGVSKKATIATIETDLNNASDQLKLYKLDNKKYPSSNDCSTIPASPPKICLTAVSGNVFLYTSYYPYNSYSLISTNASDGLAYSITNTTTPREISYYPPDASCPTGFIKVPGSVTYGTSDFCVMKYEAKNVAGVATSQAALKPWDYITQPDAITASNAACTDCHLIQEAEWLTIAQNVLGVASNWSGGSVGSGYIYSGHNDQDPGGGDYKGQAADTNDNNGYYLTNNTAPSNQRRTLTLSNGEVIWDFAGNDMEWTSGTTTEQPGITGAGLNVREWTAITNPGTHWPNPSPTTTGISGAGGWNSSNGIGKIDSNADESGVRGFLRGGGWGYGSSAGVLSLELHYSPGLSVAGCGFRAARSTQASEPMPPPPYDSNGPPANPPQ